MGVRISIFGKAATLAVLFSLVLCLGNTLQAQDSKHIKHQIGIKVSDIINGLIKSPRYGFDLVYRLKNAPKNHLRAGLSLYSRIEDNDQTLSLGLSLGFDRTIKDYGKWKFYWGIDGMSFINTNSITQKETYQFTVAPLVGAMVNFSPNFSISTEPHFNFSFISQRDRGSAAGLIVDNGFEFGLEQIGTFQINFHF